MNALAKHELRSPSFWLALAGGIAGVGGWVFTLGIQAQRLDAATETNQKQESELKELRALMADDAKTARAEANALRAEMQAGFNRVADKIDALRQEQRR